MLLFSALRPHTSTRNMWHKCYVSWLAHIHVCVHKQWHLLKLLHCNCTVFHLLSIEIHGYQENSRRTGAFQKSMNMAKLENSDIKFNTQVSIHYSEKPPQAFVSGKNRSLIWLSLTMSAFFSVSIWNHTSRENLKRVIEEKSHLAITWRPSQNYNCKI